MDKASLYFLDDSSLSYLFSVSLSPWEWSVLVASDTSLWGLVPSYGYIGYFLKGGTFFVVTYNITDMLLLGQSLSGVTLIYDLDWLVDDLDLLEKDEW